MFKNEDIYMHTHTTCMAYILTAIHDGTYA